MACARGKSSAENGAILGIGVAAVNKHLEHIYPKLGVKNRTAGTRHRALLPKFSRQCQIACSRTLSEFRSDPVSIL
ncbi:MAG: hypothetical protein DME41_11245 [Verrucomicrobia bacterium]|nr:MAG: hypothetical protein DME41_11245 [Verrucomicrobiota bacterium]